MEPFYTVPKRFNLLTKNYQLDIKYLIDKIIYKIKIYKLFKILSKQNFCNFYKVFKKYSKYFYLKFLYTNTLQVWVTYTINSKY